jgi:hypothetical protein
MPANETMIAGRFDRLRTGTPRSYWGFNDAVRLSLRPGSAVLRRTP